MSAGPNQGNTVTLAVVQGESPNPTATFSQAMAARQVVVGSGPAAQWKVRAPGVEPAHVELYWDGAALWVRDGGSLSGVYLGNDRALDWAQITDGLEVSFGQCVLRARVTGPGAVAAPVAAQGRGIRGVHRRGGEHHGVLQRAGAREGRGADARRARVGAFDR